MAKIALARVWALVVGLPSSMIHRCAASHAATSIAVTQGKVTMIFKWRKEMPTVLAVTRIVVITPVAQRPKAKDVAVMVTGILVETNEVVDVHWDQMGADVGIIEPAMWQRYYDLMAPKPEVMAAKPRWEFPDAYKELQEKEKEEAIQKKKQDAEDKLKRKAHAALTKRKKDEDKKKIAAARRMDDEKRKRKSRWMTSERNKTGNRSRRERCSKRGTGNGKQRRRRKQRRKLQRRRR